MELPELIGVRSKSVALKIRLDAIKEMEKQIEAQKPLKGLNLEGKPEREEYLMRLGFDDILKNETKASWWIDYRYMSLLSHLTIQVGRKL